MMLAMYLSANNPASVSRALQLLQGIGFLGGAVIFKTGTTVQGIKTAAAIWITAGDWAGDWHLVLGARVIVGLATALILYVTDDLLAPKESTGEPATTAGKQHTHATQDKRTE